MAKLIRICMNEDPGKRPGDGFIKNFKKFKINFYYLISAFDQIIPILEKMKK